MDTSFYGGGNLSTYCPDGSGTAIPCIPTFVAVGVGWARWVGSGGRFNVARFFVGASFSVVVDWDSVPMQWTLASDFPFHAECIL